MEKLLKVIEESAVQLVMVEGEDLPGLADLHTKFMEMVELAQKADNELGADVKVVQAAGAAAAEIVERMIMREVEDTQAAIATVSETAKCLQQLVQGAGGSQSSSVAFPKELGLGGGGSGDDSAGVGTPDAATLKLPDNVDEEIFAEFSANLPHTLESLEASILAAENEDNAEKRGAVKAILHNLKGESALMGLDEMSQVCHEAENVIESTQDAFPGEKLLAVKDWLHKAMQALSGNPVSEGEGDAPASEPTAEEAEAEAEDKDGDSLIIAEGDVPLVIDFVNESQEHLESAEADLLVIEENPEDHETLNAVFRAFHTIKGVAGFLNLHQIGSLAHVTENLLDLARKGELVLSGASIDVVFEAMDAAKQMLAHLRDAVAEGAPVLPYEKADDLIERIKACAAGEQKPVLGEILVDDGAVSQDDVTEAVAIQREQGQDKQPIGKLLVQSGAATESQVTQAVETQKREAAAAPAARAQAKNVGESTVKVTTSRLDSMINMVGELVIAQSMVSQDISDSTATNQRLARNARHLDKITRDLQELAMSMRMVPVQGVFQKMARLVRDLSRKSNKDIEFVMAGAETELDRNVVEAIADPLVHMVRNSVDHGVEPPEERVKAGKSATGRVSLRAFHRAGNIVIEITDDGRGLNKDRILKKAIDNGVVREGQEISDQDIYRLVFHAGLSTAEKVTDISGRGVGMDVVRKNIEALRGRIDIETTPGAGSTFSISLPLTLAVIDGQIVTVGGEKYIIPTVSIEQSIRPQTEQVSTVQGGRGEMMMIRGELLPLVRLHELFSVTPENTDPCESLVVVVADGAARCCLQVDTLLGQQQVVIKSLGDFLGSIQGVSGGAIMGDGNVSLILDVPGLIKLAQGEEAVA